MNKIVKLLTVLSIFGLSSCSSNSNEDTPSAAPPVNSIKKITESVYFSASPTITVINFNYENGILKQITSGTVFRSDFEISGNKIIAVKNYQNGTLYKTNNLTYSGDLLQSIQSSNNERTRFIYQGQTLNSILIDYLNGSVWSLLESRVITFDASANISEDIKNLNSGGAPASYKYSYNYDTKNSPFKEMNMYLTLLYNFESIDLLSKNNKLQRFSFTSTTSTSSTQTEYYEYVYNVQNYPISIKKKRFTTNELVSEMIIEYN